MRFLDTHGHPAEIVWNPVVFGVPLAVWVFPFHRGKLVLAQPRDGGLQWIVGIMGAGERPVDVARRVAYEQTGARVPELTAVGQFRGVRPDGGPRRSTIYVGVATRLEAVPLHSGMREPALVDPDDLTILRDGGRFMGDPSYAVVTTHLLAQDLVPRG